MRLFPAAPALLALACAGCAAGGPWWLQDLREWQGAPAAEVLEAWGPPLRTLTPAADETVLVYDRVRELDLRIERLRDPGAPLDPDRPRADYAPPQRSDCTVYFELRSDVVTAVRHEGAACDIVPRDPARRQADPEPRRKR